MSEDKIIENTETQELKPLEMIIILFPEGGMQIKFPLLNDKIISYGMLKMAEKTLDEHYHKEKIIIQPKGNLMNFVRKHLFKK